MRKCTGNTNRGLGLVAACIIMMPTSSSLRAQETTKPSPADLRLYWKDGLRFDNADKSFQFKLGGRIMNDWSFMTEDSALRAAVGDLEDGTEFRRARIYLAGTIHKRVVFKVQYDFAGGDVDFKDVYIAVKGIPHVGMFKAGHHKEPFGLE